MRSPLRPGAQRLGDVVQQGAERERLGSAGRELVEQQQRVRPDVALGMVVRRLLDAVHARDLGQHDGQQPGLVEQLEAAPGAALGEDLHDLVADALGGDVGQRRRGGDDRGARRRIDPEAEARREADGAQHAQAVLRDARRRRRRWRG